MSDQYRAVVKQSFAWWDVSGLDLPKGICQEFNDKFKAWEIRRGFRTEDDISTEKSLRGIALTAKTASKERVNALSNFTKKNGNKKNTNTKFAPDIVGKIYFTLQGAKRMIRAYIEKNVSIIPSDYEFSVNKTADGKYKIAGSRTLTPNKKSRKVSAR